MTENSGIAKGASPITVAHGLSYVTNATRIMVVITAWNATVTGQVTTRDASNFYITHTGTATATFSWYVEYNP